MVLLWQVIVYLLGNMSWSSMHFFLFLAGPIWRSVHTVRQRQRLFCHNKVKVFIPCSSGCITFTGFHCHSSTNRFQTHLLTALLSQPQQCEHSFWAHHNLFIAAKKKPVSLQHLNFNFKVTILLLPYEQRIVRNPIDNKLNLENFWFSF